MPNISELKESKFLRRSDVGAGALFTIKGCEQINVAKEGAPDDMKWCLLLEETDKPVVLNSTNAQIIAKFTGSDNTDNWTGKKVVFYDDPNISYAGKIVGGIRARAPRITNAPAAGRPAPAPAAAPADEDVPF
jgi:hypothetical protein